MTSLGRYKKKKKRVKKICPWDPIPMGSGILFNNVFLYIIPARARIRAVGIREMGHWADSKNDTDSKNEFTSGPTLWFQK